MINALGKYGIGLSLSLSPSLLPPPPNLSHSFFSSIVFFLRVHELSLYGGQETHLPVIIVIKLFSFCVLNAFSFNIQKVNCHRDVINCLLDNGANVNKLNDEGLSVLAACHVLFYTKHTWKDNIAENIPNENLFNCIQEDRQKGTHIHRNYRQGVVLDDARLGTNADSGENEENSEDEFVENCTQREHNQGESSDQRTYKIIEFTDRRFGDKDENLEELETNLNNSMKSKLDLNKNGFMKSVDDKDTKRTIDQGVENQLDSDMLTPISLHEKIADKTGKQSIMDASLFSIMSVDSTRQPSDSCDDNHSENSMEQNKQVLLAFQR